jgi:hypothetical protein
VTPRFTAHPLHGGGLRAAGGPEECTMALPGSTRQPHPWALAMAMAVACTAGPVAQTQMEFFLSFVDSAGEPVTGLSDTQITVFEDGVAGTITRFDPIDWPVRVQLLIDNGLGMGAENLQHIRTGVRGFFEALPAGVEATLLTLAPQPRAVVRRTDDRLVLMRGADLITPDNGAARFIDGLVEASGRVVRERSERERGYNHFPVLVVVGSTGPEGSGVRDRDVQRMLRELHESASTVHVVMVSTGVRSNTRVSGARQTQAAAAASEVTGGRYEAIAAPTRLATLLPEIAEQIARSHARQSNQYRVRFQRPAGADGEVGHIELQAGLPGVSVQGSLNGRVP